MAYRRSFLTTLTLSLVVATIELKPTADVNDLGLVRAATSYAPANNSAPDILKYNGACDASAAVALDRDMFIVANDEDNTLRVYRSDVGGDAVQSFSLASYFGNNPGDDETDIEGATRVGNRIYWITSHGANKNGKERLMRRQFFATDFTVANRSVTLRQAGQAGRSYNNLLGDLRGQPSFDKFNFAEAAKKAPEAPSGLNIEGLAAAPDGTMWIAFRNPTPGDRALLIRLKNPDKVIMNQTAEFGEAVELDLGKRGIRSIEYWARRRAYVIVAGSFNDTPDFKLYLWSGRPTEKPKVVDGVDLSGLNPEAAIIYADASRLQLLSDDGGQLVRGVECKDAPRKEQGFRATWVGMPAPLSPP